MIIVVLFIRGLTLVIINPLFIRLLIIIFHFMTPHHSYSQTYHRTWLKKICSVFVVVFILNNKLRCNNYIRVTLILQIIIYLLISSWNKLSPLVTSRRLHHSSLSSYLSNILNNFTVLFRLLASLRRIGTLFFSPLIIRGRLTNGISIRKSISHESHRPPIFHTHIHKLCIQFCNRTLTISTQPFLNKVIS